MRSACLLTSILFQCPCCRQLQQLRPLASSESIRDSDWLCSTGPHPQARVPASRAAARALRDAEPGAGLECPRRVRAEGSCLDLPGRATIRGGIGAESAESCAATGRTRVCKTLGILNFETSSEFDSTAR